MNAKKVKILLCFFIVLAVTALGFAESANKAVRQGNEFYNQGKFSEAIEKYDEANSSNPQALEPTFNKANSFYKQNEIDNAVELYKQIAGKSKNPDLAAKANYNLGNCYYNKAANQSQENPENAIKDFKTGISYWRQAKDAKLNNADIDKNIEAAKITIKQLKEQMQQQKQQQNQQDKNKDDQKKDENQEQDQQQKQNSSSDPNESEQQNQEKQDQQQEKSGNKDNQQQQQNQQQADNDPNQGQPQESQASEEKPKDEPEEDMVAQQILDKEQKQKEERKKLRRAIYKKVEKDW